VSVLDTIVAAHRQAAESDQRDCEELFLVAAGLPAPRPFVAALRKQNNGSPPEPISVIAEIKRRSPSKGDLCPHLDASVVASEYQAGGADALSVLTDAGYFGGSVEDLTRARSGCSLPVLRKDFTVDPRDIADARIMGADAVLLIAAALVDEDLADFADRAAALGMAALVEVHDETELRRVLDLGVTVVGVNQRDLKTFAVDRHRAAKLAERIPADVIRVAESGIGGPEDLVRLADAGYDAVLVGEHLITAADRTIALRQLRAG